MINLHRFIRNLVVSCLCVLLPTLGTVFGQGVAPIVSKPEFDETNIDSGWVGSTVCRIKTVSLLQGRIMYTLDGTNPEKNVQGSTKQYTTSGIFLTQSVWVKAIHIQNGNESEIAAAYFQRARTPTPMATFGGNPKFIAPLQCTLSVASTRSTPTIHYTRDGQNPTPVSPTYYAPFQISKTETVKAYAIAEGYDAGDSMSVAFTYLEPPPAPTVTPGTQAFHTGTLNLKVICPPIADYCRYSETTAPVDLATAGTLLTTDTVSIHGAVENDTVFFRVQAFRAGYPSSPVTTMKYAYKPAVAAPTIFPAPTTFNDTLTVTMFSATKDAVIRYEDNLMPTMNSKDGSKPIRLEKGAFLWAIAMKDGQPNSQVSKFPFNLRLTPPIPDKPSQEYVDTMKVRFTAKNPNALIFYTLDGNPPMIENGKPTGTKYEPAEGIDLAFDGSTIVNAMAYLDGITSTVSRNTYVRKEKITTLTEPLFNPPGVEFLDTLYVYLSTDEALSEVHYTLSKDGEEPNRNSPIAKKGEPIRLDSTAWLWSRAFPINGAKLDSSSIRKDKYTVTPSQPAASPMPTQAFANSVSVLLRSQTKNGIIHVLENELDRNPVTTQGWPDTHTVVMSRSGTLRAVVRVGEPPNERISSVLTLNYEIYSDDSDTLQSGASLEMKNGYVFGNNSGAPIIALPRTTDGLGLLGFKNLSLAISLQPANSGTPLKVTFTKPAGTAPYLYRIANGKVEFVTAENQAVLTQAGDYFLGVDASPPTITLLNQSPTPGGVTTVQLQVADNVLNPTCEILSEGIPGGKASVLPNAEGIVTINLQAVDGGHKGLWLRATAQDKSNTGRLPADADGKLYLSQVWSNINTPAVLTIGEGSVPWDFAGFPVGAGAPVKWSEIRDAHTGIQGCYWDMGAGAYVALNDTAVIGPGRAIWLGSKTKYSALKLDQFRAGESESDGTWRMVIQPGWNQITSPSLDRVYWPITVAKSKEVGGTYLKAPYRFVKTGKDPFHQGDSLDPWIGYYVYYWGGRDTTITLYSDPTKRPALKAAAARPASGVDLSLDPGAGMPVRLGARTWAQDGFGIEDEPNLPSMGASFSAWALRGRRNLMTDVVRFTPGEVLQWKVILDPGVESQAIPLEIVTSTAELPGKITGSLPAGYEAWALSARRGLKFRVDPGEPLPLAPESADTLSIYAGPAEKLSAIGELARASLRVERFAYTVEKERNTAWLKLDLPWTAEVEAAVWGFDGKRLASIKVGTLKTGLYRLPLKRGTDAQPALLRLKVRGPEGLREHSRRLVW